MSKRVTLMLNETQARVVLRALEEFFRLRMGQQFDLANDLAFYGYKHNTKEPELFNRAIVKRDTLSVILKAMFQIAFPPYGSPIEIDPDAHIASDIWSALRYEFGPKNDYCTTPFQMGSEPLPTIMVEEVDDERKEN